MKQVIKSILEGLAKERYSTPAFLAKNSKCRNLEFLTHYGSGFFDGENKVANKGSRQVYRRARVQPSVLFEAQIVRDSDRLLEAASESPEIGI